MLFFNQSGKAVPESIVYAKAIAHPQHHDIRPQKSNRHHCRCVQQ